MKVVLYFTIFAAIATVAHGLVTGSYMWWTCMCINEDDVNVRRTPCGTIIGTVNFETCFRYLVGRESCVINGNRYEFYFVSFGNDGGWINSEYLNKGSFFNCG